MKKLIFLIMGLILFLNAQIINITSNWQLLGAKQDINLSDFSKTCVKYVWGYNNSQNMWELYTPNQIEIPNNILPLSMIHSGEGFWIKGNSNCAVNIENKFPFLVGINTAEGIPFVNDENETVWLDVIDIINNKNIENTLKTKHLKNYNPYSFYYLRQALKNSDFLTMWLTKNWDESWFNTTKLQKYLDTNHSLMFNYWYFGDNLNQMPTNDELSEYYNNVEKVANFLSKLHGKIYFIFEPEFNKSFLTSDENKSKQFAKIISKAIDIIKTKNPNILISLCMMDTGNRGESETYKNCGYKNCALGDKYEWNKSSVVYNNLINKLDFISFQEMVAQFSRNPQNPGTMDNPNPISYTAKQLGINELDKRIYNFTNFLYTKYKKPVLLDYVTLASATWSDANGDGKIQNNEINKDGWDNYINNFYKNLRNERAKLSKIGFLGYAPMVLIDDPQHDKGGWQFFLQNEYHLGLFKTSAKDAIDKGAFGDLTPKGIDLIENIFAPDKDKYTKILFNNYQKCKKQNYTNCNYLKNKLNFYFDKVDFPIDDKSIKANFIPLYFYPDFDENNSKWQSLIDKEKNGTRVVAILNVDNGPGNSLDEIFFNAIKKLAKNGVEIIGYVHTSYASRDINAIKKDIDNWDKFYKLAGIRGIFFDEATDNVKDIDYYTQITNYASSKGFRFNALNPGSNTDESYFESNIVNIITSYEDNFNNLESFVDLNNPTIFTKKSIMVIDANKSDIDYLKNYRDEHNFDYYYFGITGESYY